jgi:hypothetical protein
MFSVSKRPRKLGVLLLLLAGNLGVGASPSSAGGSQGALGATAPPEVEQISSQMDRLAGEVGVADALVRANDLSPAVGASLSKLDRAASEAEEAVAQLRALSVRRPFPRQAVRIAIADGVFIKLGRVAARATDLGTQVGAATTVSDTEQLSGSIEKIRALSYSLSRTASAYLAQFQERIILDLGARSSDRQSERLPNGLAGPLNPQRLQNGNTLVALTADNQVVELNRFGAVVWQFTGVRYPTDAQRLPGGNTLIADRDEMRAIEVRPDGSIAWQYGNVLNLYGARRLASGNTLLAVQGDYSDVHPGVILEVNPAGETVWSYGGSTVALLAPSAERLANGHTLIADNSGFAAGTARVIEVDAAGAIVWSYSAGIYGVYGVHRLPNGNTLINDQGNGRIIEVNPRGETVWRFGGMDTPGGFDVLAGGGLAIAEWDENRVYDIAPPDRGAGW